MKQLGNLGRTALSAVVVACLLPSVAAAAISPTVHLSGYSIEKVGQYTGTAGIVQMAFNPNDPNHLYVSRRAGQIVRLDYNAATGQLTNPFVVASGLGREGHGLAFHNNDLYVSLDLGGSRTVRPGDGRITRLSNPNASGAFQTRHDFVHSINKGDHDVNQIQIVGDSLYVGIGAATRTGNPAQENIYTMTIARIADLNAIDFSGPIDPFTFKGPVNYLADPTEWTNTAPNDGKLRYFASGFRNPFGLAFDDEGKLWVSTNGNSDPGYLSHDLLYKDVTLGSQGTFPPESFGFGDPHIIGTPIEPLVDLGQSPSPTGMDFVAVGPDKGKLVLAQYGATLDPNIGKNLLLIDPVTGEVQVLASGFDGPTDVLRDPFGRLLVTDHDDGTIWLLTTPVPEPHALMGLLLGAPLLLARRRSAQS